MFVGLVGTVFITVILLAEILLRVIGFHDPFFYRYNQYAGVALNPGARGWYTREGRAEVQINSAGFRDREYTLEKPADVFRIAILGDSYAEALQVPIEQTFWTLLEQYLNERECFFKKRVEVLNFGVSGYGTTQELLILRHYVKPYAPDLVVIAMCTGNDVRNNSKTLESRAARPFFLLQGDTLVLDTSYKKS